MSNTIEIYKEKLNNNNEIRIILFYKEPTDEAIDTVIFPYPNINFEHSKLIKPFLKERNILKKLDSDDWKYFANQDLEQATKNLSSLEEQKANTQDKQLLEELGVSIENAKIDKEVAEYRINQDIKYGTDYLNQALDTYQN